MGSFVFGRCKQLPPTQTMKKYGVRLLAFEEVVHIWMHSQFSHDRVREAPTIWQSNDPGTVAPAVVGRPQIRQSAVMVIALGRGNDQHFVPVSHMLRD